MTDEPENAPDEPENAPDEPENAPDEPENAPDEPETRTEEESEGSPDSHPADEDGRRALSEPTEDERERADRIKRLREGEAEPRQQRRRPDVPDEAELEEQAETADVDHEGPIQPGEELDVPADAPEDLAAASLYLTEGLRTKLERIEEHLHLRYSVEYDADLDGPRYVRPLALYLGIRQFERLDLEEIHALFEEVEEVESPH